jgi:Arm domain-containing DNA-binding protein
VRNPNATLTPAAINSMQVGDHLTLSGVPGLEIRRHTFGFSWLLFYRNRLGLARQPKIGAYPAISIAQARSIARQWLAQVAGGKDPSQEIQTVRHDPNMNALWERCEKEHYDQKKKWGRDAKSIYRRHIKPAVGAVRVRALVYDDAQRIHTRLGATPFEANRTIAVLSKMLNLAERWGYRDTGSNPCQHVTRYREPRRRRYPTR